MKWIPSFQAYDSVSVDNARLVLSEAEKNLTSTVADAESLTRTAIYVLGVMILILSGCAGLLVKVVDWQLPIEKQSWHLIAAHGAVFIYVFLTVLRLLDGAFKARGIEHIGNTPESLMKAEYLNQSHSALLLLEASSCRDRILKNANRNKETGIAINIAIRWLCVTPLVFLTVLFGVTILRHP